MNADEKAIAAVLEKYEHALNQSSTDAVMKLYASDGVFMPQNSPSSVGAQAVRRAYAAVFDAISGPLSTKVPREPSNSLAIKALPPSRARICLALDRTRC